MHQFPKDQVSDEPNNYRPIFLLSIIGKALKRIIHSRVTPYLECTYPPMQSQWGVKPERSTTSAVLSNRFTVLEESKKISAVFFDLTKDPRQNLAEL